MAIALISEQRARQLIRDVQELKQRSGIPPIDARRPVSGLDDGIPFYNADSITIPPYSIVRVSNTITSDDLPLPSCLRPDVTYGLDYLINGPDEVEAGQIGVAQTGPLVKFVYSGSAPTTKTTYGPKPSQFTGELGYPALVRVIGTADTTAKWAYGFLLSPIVTLLGKASGSITARSGTTVGTGSMEIWYNNAGTLTDAGFSDITVKNLSASAVTSGGYIQAKWIGSDWFVDFEDCP